MPVGILFLIKPVSSLMTSRVRSPLLLLLCVLLFFLALGNHQLQNSTEPRVAGIAMEMHLSGNWITPKLNNQPFLEIGRAHV